MAYYSGMATSYSDLLNALVSACTSNGWNWQNSILSKDGCFIKLNAIITGTSQGIVATGGTGVANEVLVNPASIKPRLGAASNFLSLAVFPVSYHIFIFEKEVFLKIKFSINSFFYLAFGRSTTQLTASGLWVAATSGESAIYTDGRGGYSIDSNGGIGGNNSYQCVTPFGRYNSSVNDTNHNATICHGIDGGLWSTNSSGGKDANSIQCLTPLFARQPSNWSSETILLPISVYVQRPSSKRSLICQFQNARFLRVANYEPEQIITLGNDKWMVFPFYKKNSEQPDGGYISDHTGTFGWAIRYDGP